MKALRQSTSPRLLLLLIACCSMLSTASAQRPNVIVMQPDDLPFFEDWSPPPNNPSQPDKTVPTPDLFNMERLRLDGVQMMQAYTTSPMCGTSRFSTITGRYPSRAASSRKKASDSPQVVDIPTTKLRDVGEERDCTETNLAVAFSQLGYQTGMVGKWHLSAIKDQDYTYELAQATVQNCGFNVVEGLYLENLHSGDTTNSYSDGTFSHNMEWITYEAIQFIEGAVEADEPFFLYFNPTVPHSSHDVKTALTDFPCTHTANGIADNDFVIPGMTDNGSCEDYRATVLERAGDDDEALGAIWVDDAIGALLQTLEDNNLLDDTIFVFQQDHGMETKGALYENGVRIAQFVHYPKRIDAGTQLRVPVSTMDLAPTLLEYAGVEELPYDMDGKSWKHLIESDGDNDDHHGCLYFEGDRDRAVRCGCYKYLLLNDESGTQESGQRFGYSTDTNNLYDLCGGTDEYIVDGDNQEATNLWDEDPETAALLLTEMECHLERTNPNLPSDYEAECRDHEDGEDDYDEGEPSEEDDDGPDEPSPEDDDQEGPSEKDDDDGDDGNDDDNTITVETTFVIANTEGYTADDVTNEFEGSLETAFRNAIAKDGFVDLVLAKLEGSGGGGGGGEGDGGGGGGGGGITCPTDGQYEGTPSEVAAAAPLRGSIGCVDAGADALRDREEYPVKDDQDAFNIYGPMEAGFTSATPQMSCLGNNVVPSGLDTNLAEHVVAYFCGSAEIQVLDGCGGHAVPYHYHERMNCLYESDPTTGHSTRVGTAGDGNGIYGKYVDGGEEPTDLDACGGRWGVTPDSNGAVVYYYPITSAAPFSLGCYGPVESVEECRALYSTCGAGADIAEVTTEYGTGEYALDCPCFDEDGSNVEGQGRPGFLAPSSGRKLRRLSEDIFLSALYRRGSPQVRRFLEEFDIDLESVAILEADDVECPSPVSDSEALCQFVELEYKVMTDGSMAGRRFLRLIEEATLEWIQSGALEEELPDGSPFTIVLEDESETDGVKKVLPKPLPVERAGDEMASQSKDTIVVKLKPKFAILFSKGHQGEEPPEASEIEALSGQTESYIQSKLREEYGKLFRSLQLEGIEHTYQVHPQHQFELSFTAFAILDAAAMAQGKAVGDLLSNAHNLRQYIGQYARFSGEDGTQSNGLFSYIETVHARITASVVDEGISA